MEITIKSISRSLVVFIILLISCGEKTEPEPTKSQLVVQNWRVTSVTVNGQTVNPTGFSIRFQSSGSFSFSTPGISGLPQSGTWAFNNTETVIILNGSTELPIRTLTKTSFSFDYTYQNHKEGNVTVQFVMGM